MPSGWYFDGKPVRKLLFGRWMHTAQSWFLVEVECTSKDHAIQRLIQAYGYTTGNEWEFIDELDLEHFVGLLGESLPLNPAGTSYNKH